MWQNSPVRIVEFLEDRIDEEEARLAHAEAGSPSAARLTRRLLAECAQKRAIIEDWKQAAEEAGISSAAEAMDSMAVARRGALGILAAAYRNHPDFPTDWRD